jgi:DNA-binding NarL/FixJ family response regulator
MNKNKIKIFLVDDHQIFRRGLKLLLQELGYNIVDEANDGNEFLEKLPNTNADIVFYGY